MTGNGVQRGDRFRARADVLVHVGVVYRGAGSGGGKAVLPAGTVVVALDPVDGAVGGVFYPETYDELEAALVPAKTLNVRNYWAYHLSLRFADLERDFERLEAMSPPPENRLPRDSAWTPER